MGRRPTRKARRKAPPPPPTLFTFLGYQDGWYHLRATDLDLATSNDVVEWLIDEGVTIGKWAWAGNGDVYPDRPRLPVSDSSQFGVLLKRPADVLRFEMAFTCAGITPQTMLNAIRMEAAKVRLTSEGVSRVAYEALRSLNAMTGMITPPWETMPTDSRRSFITEVRQRIASPVTINPAATVLEQVRDSMITNVIDTLRPLLDI